MKILAVAALAALVYVAPLAVAGDEYATIIRRNGVVEYVPDSHVIYAVPRGFNTKRYDLETNPNGHVDGRFPLLDAMCAYSESGEDHSGLGFGHGADQPQQPGVSGGIRLGFGGSLPLASEERQNPCIFNNTPR